MAQPVAVHMQSAPVAEAIDHNGDVVFRFRLRPMPDPDTLTLQEIYRQNIHDLLHLVRLYYRGEPVLIDEFAFLDAPDTRVRILNGQTGS